MKVKRSKSCGRIQVSKHFFLHSFCRDRPAPHPLQVQKIFRLAAGLEEVIKKEGGEPTITGIEGDFDAVVYCFLGGDTYEHRGRTYRYELP